MPKAIAGAQLYSVGDGVELGQQGQRAAGEDQLVEPGVDGDGHRPYQPGDGEQPADRVGRPPQGQHQPDGGVAEREGQREEGALGQHPGGERPGHEQGHHQPGRAAGHGGQPQQAGQHGPGPRVQAHRLLARV
ncbi:MAG TPA: hypothetical protein VK713_03460, partial [Actinomycetes bacterium]|nr:hypothetical protein [Actinomycetes bacterium]